MKKQNVVLKAGVGLGLGVGAMVFAPKMAMASTPCTPDTAPTVTRDDTPCTGDCRIIHITFIDKGCYDLDGDCAKETHYVEEVILQSCSIYPCFHHELVTTPAPC